MLSTVVAADVFEKARAATAATLGSIPKAKLRRTKVARGRRKLRCAN
jgi:hypothetical protein